MKRLSTYVATIVLTFVLFLVPSYAMVSEEVKEEIVNYATELSSIKTDLVTELNRFQSWSNNYAGSTRKVLTRSTSKNVTSALKNEDYDSAFSILESALREYGEGSAADALSLLKSGFLNTLNRALDYEARLTSFLKEHEAEILVADMLPLLDEARMTYNGIRTPFKSILDLYYDAYYDMAKSRLDQYKMYSVSSLESLFDDFETDLYIYEDYADMLNNKIESTKTLILNLKLDGLGFEEQFYNDVKPYVTKVENLASDVYQEFVERQWQELRGEGEAIVGDTSKTIQERNQMLLEKIEMMSNLKEKAKSKFDELKSHTTVNRILKRAEKLETKALKECDDAIEYIRSLLLVEEYDLVVRDGVTSDQVSLNRDRHLLITKNEYHVNTFLSFLKVKNETAGHIVSNNIYNDMVGTKSLVGVADNSSWKVTYNVVLKGDTRPNGIIDISDITYTIRTVLNNGNGMDEIEKIAGDMNDDNKIDISDVTATIRKVLSK